MKPFGAIGTLDLKLTIVGCEYMHAAQLQFEIH